MSTEAILTLLGILVTLALAGLGLIISLFGWFLGREVAGYDKTRQQTADLVQEVGQLRARIVRLEQVNGIKTESPIVKYKPQGGASA